MVAGCVDENAAPKRQQGRGKSGATASRPAGAYSVADPRRPDGVAAFGQYGVKGWDDTSQTAIGKAAVGAGHFAVADPRHGGPEKFNNVYRVVPWDRHAAAVTSRSPRARRDVPQRVQDRGVGRSGAGDHRPACAQQRRHVRGRPAHALARGHPPEQAAGASLRSAGSTVTGSDRVASGALCVADPRARTEHEGRGKYRITGWDAPSGTVISASGTGNGAFVVADPRSGLTRGPGDAYVGAGHYGVVRWENPTGAIPGSGKYDNGGWCVADPRMPAGNDRLVAVIRSMDGTWHRPFTTLELAALQSLVDPEEQLELDGLSDAQWRERVGNSAPPAAAEAIASTMGTTLLLAWSGAVHAVGHADLGAAGRAQRPPGRGVTGMVKAKRATRRRASYAAAIAWMADYDDNEWLKVHGVEELLPSVTASLVADLFGRTDQEVAADIGKPLRRREAT